MFKEGPILQNIFKINVPMLIIAGSCTKSDIDWSHDIPAELLVIQISLIDSYLNETIAYKTKLLTVF